ncbi:unnamed protein product, partial [Owenia fusiformis]
NLLVDPDDTDFWIASTTVATTDENVQRTQTGGVSNGLELYICIPMGIIAFILLVIGFVYILIIRKKRQVKGEDDYEDTMYQRTSKMPAFVTNPVYNSKHVPVQSRRLPEIPV